MACFVIGGPYSYIIGLLTHLAVPVRAQFIIGAQVATKQSRADPLELDCFAPLAMTVKQKNPRKTAGFLI
jgi:hypothetical protein